MAPKKPVRKIHNLVDGHAFPDFSKIQSSVDIIKAINYANYVYEPKELKEFAKRFMNKTLTNIPEFEFRHHGVVCWLLQNDCPFMDGKAEATIDAINALELVYKKDSKPAITAAKVSFKELHTKGLMLEVEGYIDDVMLDKGRRLLQESVLLYKDADLEVIKAWVNKQIEAIDDPELSEHFQGRNEYKKKIREGLQYILETLNTTKTFVKKTKTIKRSTKQKSPTMIVKKIKYLKEFPEMNLKSIAPEKLVGSSSLWLYNVKTRKIYNYVSEVGLTAKGGSLYNYTPEKSFMKTLRNPKEQIDELMKSSKVEQRKFMETIKTTAYPANGRFSSDIIILKAF